MVIGIDGNEANVANRVGIGQFAYNVIKNLEAIDKVNSYQIYLKNPPLSDMPKSRTGWSYQVFGPKKLWTQFALPLRLYTQKQKPDIFYSPSHYAPRFCPVPTVISLMDLWHHRHPEQFAKKDSYQLLNWEKYSVNNAKKIITISEFSKREIHHFYPDFTGEVIVAYPGYTKTKNQNFRLRQGFPLRQDFGGQVGGQEKIKNKYGITGNYFLYLGTLQPKKNLEGLLRGYAEFLQLPITASRLPKLIIAGKKGWLFDTIFALVKELKVENQVIFTGFTADEDKDILIAGSKGFVLPSFYEGFGIPIAEAMALGVPVAIANAASLPEVGGKGAIYFDPNRPGDIARALSQIVNLNKEKLNEIIRTNKAWVQQFTWEKCARTILSALTRN